MVKNKELYKIKLMYFIVKYFFIIVIFDDKGFLLYIYIIYDLQEDRDINYNILVLLLQKVEISSVIRLVYVLFFIIISLFCSSNLLVIYLSSMHLFLVHIYYLHLIVYKFS